MLFQIAIASLALAGRVLSALAAPARTNSSSPLLNWGPCEFASGVETTAAPVVNFTYQCSSFSAPLDYLDTSVDKTFNIPVIRIPAVNGKSQGIIYFNFGGPGFEDRMTLVSVAEQLLVTTGGTYDLVTWDPRGVANVTPFKCYNDAERVAIMNKHRVNDAFGPKERTALARMWASAGNMANDCLNSPESASEIGELIGTGYTVRDLMQLKDALEGPDALVNYWGLSYGTVLGVTLAAMYPEKMGRVMLDGNVNIVQWYNGWDTIWWSDVDKAVKDYFDRCVRAGPGLCALSSRNESADVLNAKLYDLMDELRSLPIPLGQATVLDASAFKLALRSILYGNPLWPTFSVLLSELFVPAPERNLTAIAAIWIPLAKVTDTLSNLKDESVFGIFCSDKHARTSSFSEALAVSSELAGVSKALGEVPNNVLYLCAQWPYHAKGGYERSNWSGAETIRTANPMLFVGPRYDPVTPIANAYNNSAVFAGSAVLVHGGIGHGTLGHPSVCTAKAIRAYFRDGELPAEGLNCSADNDAFDLTKTWRDSYLPEMAWWE